MTIKKTVISMAGEQKGWINTPSMLVAALLISAPIPVLAAVYEDDEEDAEADYSEVALVTQRINQFSNVVDFRLRYLTDDAFKFGEYNSQEDKGWQIDGNFDLEQRDFEDGSAKYFKAEGNSIGTKSRDITLEGGQQGDHKFQISFDGIEKQSHGTFNNQYTAAPSDPYSLTRIAGQAPGALDDQDPGFNQPVKAYRERLGILLKKQTSSHWRFTADANQENKKGTRDYAANGTFFLYPIDYTTSNVNLMAEYLGKGYQFQLGYEFSQFDNAGKEVTGTAKDPAQEPDNLMQTLFWNGIYRFSDKTRANAFFSYAVAEQNEDLIGPDATSSRTTADAQVNNLIARVGVSTRLTNKLSAEAKYDYRDNDTKASTFKYDSTKTRQSQAFDTTWESLALTASYRLPKSSKIGLGYKHEEIERPDQDRETTKEDKLWASYKLPMMGRFSGTFKLSAADRDGSDYNTNAINETSRFGAAAQEGTQRLNFADRKQIKAQFRGQYQLGNTGYVGAMLQSWNDDYSAAQLGLQEVDGQMYTLDFGATPMRELSYSLYAGMQVFTYEQRGSGNGDKDAALIDPLDLWSHKTTDDGLFAGFHMDWEVVASKVATSIDYRYTKTTGELDQFDAAGPVTPLEDIVHEVHRIELTGEYFLDKQTTLVARAVYEDYESFNWAYNPATPYSNQSFEDPNHNAASVELGVRYQF